MKHIVGFSGGADSQATALWCRERFPKEDVILLNSDAGGNESPLTTAFIRWYSETIHPVVMISPEVQDIGNRAKGDIEARGLKPSDPLSFDLLAELKHVFPRKRMQFCTTHLKLWPQKRWHDQHFPPRIEDGIRMPTTDVERYAGVRRDESRDRADMAEREYDEFFGTWLNRPLATWTKAQVFKYLADAGEEVNPLYRLGFSRVGCAPCVNSNKDDIRMWAARFPEMIDKVRAWEKRVGKTFFPPIMPRAVKGGPRLYGWVDEVVEWAQTARGGFQGSLPLLESDVESGQCMSAYGLCE